MRSSMGSSLTTILMITPLVLIPVLAITGLPRDRMLDASLATVADPSATNDSPVSEIGQSDFSDPQDLFSDDVPVDDIVSFTSAGTPQSPPTLPERMEDPFRDFPGLATEIALDRTNAQTPPEALSGWEREAEDRLIESPLQDGLTPLPSSTRSQTDPDQIIGKIPQSYTWPTAIARLNQLGIRSYRWEPGPDGTDIHFHCSYSPAGNPNLSRRFMAEASDPLDAVVKVLGQIEQWHAERQR